MSSSESDDGYRGPMEKERWCNRVFQQPLIDGMALQGAKGYVNIIGGSDIKLLKLMLPQ